MDSIPKFLQVQQWIIVTVSR